MTVTDMHSLLTDVAKNVPQGEEAFQEMKEDKIKGSCNFRKVCE